MLLRLLDTPQGVWQGTLWGGAGNTTSTHITPASVSWHRALMETLAF